MDDDAVGVLAFRAAEEKAERAAVLSLCKCWKAQVAEDFAGEKAHVCSVFCSVF